MNPKLPQLLSWIAVAALMALSACTKQAEAPKVATPKAEAPKPVTVDVVRETERSKSFLAVSRQLELGGPLYAYMDVDGDVLTFAGRNLPIDATLHPVTGVFEWTPRFDQHGSGRKTRT